MGPISLRLLKGHGVIAMLHKKAIHEKLNAVLLINKIE
jgi:hypothetical protein